MQHITEIDNGVNSQACTARACLNNGDGIGLNLGVSFWVKDCTHYTAYSYLKFLFSKFIFNKKHFLAYKITYHETHIWNQVFTNICPLIKLQSVHYNHASVSQIYVSISSALACFIDIPKVCQIHLTRTKTWSGGQTKLRRGHKYGW